MQAAKGYSRELRDLGHGQRLGHVGFHQAQRLHRLRVCHPALVDDGDGLHIGQAAPLGHQQIGHLVGQLAAAGRLREQIGHQIQRCHAAAAGIAVAVDFKKMLGHDNFGELFGQRLVVFPVDGAAVAVQQAGLRHQVRAGVDAAQRNAAGRHFFQPQRERAQAPFGDGVGSDHKDHV